MADDPHAGAVYPLAAVGAAGLRWLQLAGVLVIFGLAIVLAAPFWRRLRESSASRGAIAVNFGRVARFAPVISGAVILVFGIAMAWSSVIRG